MKINKKILLSTLALISISSIVYADGLDTVSTSSLTGGAGKIFKWVFGFLALVWGAVGYARAGYAYSRNEEGEAFERFKNTSIAILIILSSWGITRLVISFIS